MRYVVILKTVNGIKIEKEAEKSCTPVWPFMCHLHSERCVLKLKDTKLQSHR